MQRIRIYKDLKIQWKVLTNKEALPLEGRDLTFEIVNKFERVSFPFSVEGNLLTADFPGTAHKSLGDYWVTLWENKGKEGQTLVDSCAGFTLVSTTCMEDDSDNTLNGAAVVSLESNIEFGVKGDSAYEIWLKQGYTGTVSDFMDWLREPATSIADSVSQAEAERVKAEKERESAETERAMAEDNRELDENARNFAENARKTAESERKEAESERKEAESERMAEFSRLKTESETATDNATKAATRANDAAAAAEKAASMEIVVDAETGIISVIKDK